MTKYLKFLTKLLLFSFSFSAKYSPLASSQSGKMSDDSDQTSSSSRFKDDSDQISSSASGSRRGDLDMSLTMSGSRRGDLGTSLTMSESRRGDLDMEQFSVCDHIYCDIAETRKGDEEANSWAEFWRKIFYMKKKRKNVIKRGKAS